MKQLVLAALILSALWEMRHQEGKPKSELTAQSFRLVDGEGRVRGELTFVESDCPALVLRDQQGTVRASVVVSSGGEPSFMLCNKDEGVVASLRIQDDITALSIAAPEANGGEVVLASRNNGFSTVGVSDTGGALRFQVNVDSANDMATVFLRDSKKTDKLALCAGRLQGEQVGSICVKSSLPTSSVEITANDEGDGGLVLNDRQGKSRVFLRTFDKSGVVGVNHINGTPAAMLFFEPDSESGHIGTLNKDGKSLFER